MARTMAGWWRGGGGGGAHTVRVKPVPLLNDRVERGEEGVGGGGGGGAGGEGGGGGGAGRGRRGDDRKRAMSYKDLFCQEFSFLLIWRLWVGCVRVCCWGNPAFYVVSRFDWGWGMWGGGVGGGVGRWLVGGGVVLFLFVVVVV